jgi:hypothetical protein
MLTVMRLLRVFKAPWVVWLYRCLFTASLVYFGSFLRLLHHGSPVSGILVIGGFPLCSFVGLLASFIRIPLSRWIVATFGIVIPGAAFGGLFIFLGGQGWFDNACGVFIWLAIVGVPLSWGWVLFKDKATNEYFGC